MKEGGCPITKMFKLAGTPQMGAILIVLFVILGALSFFVLESFKDSNRSGEWVLSSGADRSEQEEIEKGLERMGQARGYIRIMNDPGKEPGTDPGTDPGNDPGTDPGNDPGKEHGTESGTDPGSRSSRGGSGEQ